MNTLLLVNTTIGFSENLFLVNQVPVQAKAQAQPPQLAQAQPAHYHNRRPQAPVPVLV